MAKPKLCLIPATIGDKVYSILPSNGVGDFDFTRASTATRINAQGLIETVASGENRLNYSLLDGEVVGCPHLLLEPSRTNLLPYSEDFSNVAWLKSNATIISDSIISPDGTLNADELQVTSSGGNIYDNIGGSGDGVFSVFAKYKDVQYIRLRSTGSYAFFDIKNGVLGGTINTIDTKIEKYPNGWYKCSVIGNNTNSLAQIFVSSDGANVGQGNVYLWGADFQNGSYPTSHIKTDGTITTRAAETCTGSGDAATFNDSEGVLMAEISALSNDTASKSISLVDVSTDNAIELFYFNGSSIYINLWSGGVSQGFLNYEINVKDFIKVCYSYKLNDTALWVNGFKVYTDTSASMPIGLSNLKFKGRTNNNPFYGKTKQLQYFDSVLDSEQLEQLTSWDSFRAMAEGQLYSIE